MKVKDIMHRLVHTARAASNLEDAARHMRDQDIGFLPIVEEVLIEDTHLKKNVLEKIGFTPVVEEEVLVGVVTDRDIVVRGIASGKEPKTTPISEVMTHEFACCHQDDDIADAAAVMEEKKVRRLFALDSEEHVAGVLSVDDISVADARVSGEVLQATAE